MNKCNFSPLLLSNLSYVKFLCFFCFVSNNMCKIILNEEFSVSFLFAKTPNRFFFFSFNCKAAREVCFFFLFILILIYKYAFLNFVVLLYIFCSSQLPRRKEGVVYKILSNNKENIISASKFHNRKLIQRYICIYHTPYV